MKVENMQNQNGRSAANQFIITDGNIVTFQSYNSTIASYNKDTNILTVHQHWNYSQTTLKYFKHFVNSYTHFTYETKSQWQKEMKEEENIEFVIKLA